jgi:hypothetical protein
VLQPVKLILDKAKVLLGAQQMHQKYTHYRVGSGSYKLLEVGSKLLVELR